jgi:hypothetical protein
MQFRQGKVVPVLINHHGMKTYEGEVVQLYVLTSELRGGECSPSRSGHFTPDRPPSPDPVHTLWRKLSCPCQESILDSLAHRYTY